MNSAFCVAVHALICLNRRQEQLSSEEQPCLEASGMSEVMDGLLEELDQGCRSRLSEISLAELDSRLYLKQRR